MNKSILSETIKDQRKKSALSQEKLSAKADISPRNYRRIEAGEHTPDLATIFKLCAALDLHYSDLIEPVFQDFQEAHEK